MDYNDGTIDISHMTAEERREHYRHINQLTTCPCVYCTSPCRQGGEVANCDRYQEWREFNMQIRGWKKTNAKDVQTRSKRNPSGSI